MVAVRLLQAVRHRNLASLSVQELAIASNTDAVDPGEKTRGVIGVWALHSMWAAVLCTPVCYSGSSSSMTAVACSTYSMLAN